MTRIRAREFVSVLVLTLGICAGPARAQQQPFLLGAYPNEQTDAFETMIGHTIGLVSHFQSFTVMPGAELAADLANGRTPMVTWTSELPQNASALALDILAGKYDQQLTSQADAYAAFGGTILLEWQPEMTNNPRDALFMTGVAPNLWGPTYVSVWQYIHNIFVARGATNLKWVWSPGGTGYEVHRNGLIPAQPYFPGTAYVDWMGLHSYNKSDTPAAYDANPELLAFYTQAPAWAPGLPLIHGQTGATSYTDAQREWIATAESSLQTKFPLVRALVYFNAPGKNPGPGQSKLYPLQGAGLDAFKTMAADPYFQ